jgi:leucine-rich repeat transmembrane neuronal protein 1/2
MAVDGSLFDFENTATFGKEDHIVQNSLTFKTRHTFIGLRQLTAYTGFNIYFQIRTSEADGLIMYNKGKDGDFFAVELHDGHVYYVFNLGDGPIRLADGRRTTVSDNQWHSISISRPASTQHILMVDEQRSIATSAAGQDFDFVDLLYLGE